MMYRPRPAPRRLFQDFLGRDPDGGGFHFWKLSLASDFGRREFNRAFVLMQYFGYLQRNPDEGRDADLSGYEHRLAKLEQFGGDFQTAELVKAFINSDGYRARFCRR